MRFMMSVAECGGGGEIYGFLRLTRAGHSCLSHTVTLNSEDISKIRNRTGGSAFAEASADEEGGLVPLSRKCFAPALCASLLPSFVEP